MRVMQLIDSLELGGAERVAVTYANMLVGEIEKSYLCTTREEGPLKEHLDTGVSYSCFDRQKTLDFKALNRAVHFIKKEEISIIHAHGTSYFFAFLIKQRYRTAKIVWHNHHGASREYGYFKTLIIKSCVRVFDTILVVNNELKEWTVKRLKFPESKCHYIANFVNIRQDVKPQAVLDGEPSLRVISLANLRPPKEHLFLCTVFNKVLVNFPKATLHLVGKDYRDDYSDKIKEFIALNDLGSSIFIHGQQAQAQSFLNACTIGVIASSSEGLPMSLLEYGRAHLAVVTTAVGQCAAVVGAHGYTVPQGDTVGMGKALEKLLSDENKRKELASAFAERVATDYSMQTIRSKVLTLYWGIHG